MSKICTTNYEAICPVYQTVQDYLSLFVNPRRIGVNIIIPTYIPPAIRYKFEGRPEVVVNNGVRYELDEQEGEYGLGNYVVSFNITRQLWNQFGTQLINTVTDRWEVRVSNVKWVGLVAPSQTVTGGFQGTCLPWVGLGYSIVTAAGEAITYRVRRRTDPPTIIAPPSGTLVCVGAGGSWNFQNRYAGISNVVVNQTSGEPPSSNCTIRVYDKDDNLLVTDTGNECPEVDSLAEACFYDMDNESPFFTVLEATDVSYWNIRSNIDSTTGRHCTFITNSVLQLDIVGQGKLGLRPQESGAVITACSPKGCDIPPLACFTCLPPPDEECENCPSNTATTVLDGSNLLCVDSQGCVIATIRYDPECHNPDCLC